MNSKHRGWACCNKPDSSVHCSECGLGKEVRVKHFPGEDLKLPYPEVTPFTLVDLSRNISCNGKVFIKSQFCGKVVKDKSTLEGPFSSSVSEHFLCIFVIVSLIHLLFHSMWIGPLFLTLSVRHQKSTRWMQIVLFVNVNVVRYHRSTKSIQTKRKEI